MRPVGVIKDILYCPVKSRKGRRRSGWGKKISWQRKFRVIQTSERRYHDRRGFTIPFCHRSWESLRKKEEWGPLIWNRHERYVIAHRSCPFALSLSLSLSREMCVLSSYATITTAIAASRPWGASLTWFHSAPSGHGSVPSTGLFRPACLNAPLLCFRIDVQRVTWVRGGFRDTEAESGPIRTNLGKIQQTIWAELVSTWWDWRWVRRGLTEASRLERRSIASVARWRVPSTRRSIAFQSESIDSAIWFTWRAGGRPRACRKRMRHWGRGRECGPIASPSDPGTILHFFLSDREHVELRDDAGKKQRTRHHRQQNIENGLVNFMDCVS